MILRQSDLPRAQYEADDDLDSYLKQPLQAAGLSGRAAQYYGLTYSQQKGSLQVSGVVITVATAAAAQKALAIVKKARDTTLRPVASDWTTLSLPSYGDQQIALVNPPGNEGLGFVELIVRKKTVVWLLYVSLERRPKPPVSEIVADVKRYAAKLKQRVGTG